MTEIQLGKVMLTFKGEYDSTKSYTRLDAVTYQGSSYVCLSDTTSVPPSESWQLLADKGADGQPGKDGQPGSPGVTPHIDATTGNWFIGTTNTGVKAQGPAGQNGSDGKPGSNGSDGKPGADGVTPHIDSATGHWFVGTTDTGVSARGPQGEQGSPGKDGQTPDVSNLATKTDLAGYYTKLQIDTTLANHGLVRDKIVNPTAAQVKDKKSSITTITYDGSIPADKRTVATVGLPAPQWGTLLTIRNDNDLHDSGTQFYFADDTRFYKRDKMGNTSEWQSWQKLPQITDIPSLTGYAKLTDLPNTSGFATTDSLNEVRTTAESASSAASSAQSAAQEAQSTATVAQSAASQAQSIADTANRTAQAAQNTANNAESRAESAYSLASTSSSDAKAATLVPVITSGTLADLANKQGVYHYEIDFIPSDSPTQDGGLLDVVVGTNQAKQVFTNTANADVYVRTRKQGVWSAWRQVTLWN